MLKLNHVQNYDEEEAEWDGLNSPNVISVQKLWNHVKSKKACQVYSKFYWTSNFFKGYVKEIDCELLI